VSAIDKEPKDIDAQLRAETEKLIADMEELMKRARAIVSAQRQGLDTLRAEREKLRENVKEIKKNRG
jgi:hypothetical protein